MEHIGEILRTAREDNFYTQKKVMELTGINRKTLSGYENSVAEPDLDTFARLLRLYQLSADEVLGIKTSTPPLAVGPFARGMTNAYALPQMGHPPPARAVDSVSISRRLSR